MTFCTELNSTRVAIGCTMLSLLLLCIFCTGAAGQFSNQPTDIYEDYDADIPKRETSHPSRAMHDNGMLHLVLHHLSLKLIKEMDSENETMLNMRQRQIVHDKITGFYDDFMKHPALNNNRVAFNKTGPDFIKLRQEKTGLSGRRVKRGTSGRLTEICTSVSGWQEKSEGVTRNHDVVALYAAQHFYTTTCVRNGQSCNHIDESTTTSECRSRSSWTIAYVADGPHSYTWEWIAVDTCCSCAASS